MIRAKCNRIQSIPNELTLLINNLPSGYHRDMQLTKEILFPCIEELKSCLQLLMLMLENIQVKENILADERYKYLFSVEAVNELVNNGVPFREAYRQIGDAIEKNIFLFDPVQMKQHTHEGSMGNLCNNEIRQSMQKLLNHFE